MLLLIIGALIAVFGVAMAITVECCAPLFLLVFMLGVIIIILCVNKGTPLFPLAH